MIYDFNLPEPLEGSCDILVNDEHDLLIDAFHLASGVGITEKAIRRRSDETEGYPGGLYIKVSNLSTFLKKTTLSELRAADMQKKLPFAQRNLQGLIEKSYLADNGIATFMDKIPVFRGNLGHEITPAVEGRVVYDFLKIKETTKVGYKVWIEERISALGEHFEKGVDFCHDDPGCIGEKEGEKYYALSTRMAKQICAKDCGPVGVGFVDYLLACEASLKKVAQEAVNQENPGGVLATTVIMKELARVEQLRRDERKQDQAAREADRIADKAAREADKKEIIAEVKGMVTEVFQKIAADFNAGKQGNAELLEHQQMMFSEIRANRAKAKEDTEPMEFTTPATADSIILATYSVTAVARATGIKSKWRCHSVNTNVSVSKVLYSEGLWQKVDRDGNVIDPMEPGTWEPTDAWKDKGLFEYNRSNIRFTELGLEKLKELLPKYTNEVPV